MRISIITLLFLVVTLNMKGQQTAEKFIQTTQYLLYLPDDYPTDTSKRFPLMVFLHGSGESGEDLAKVKLHGPPQLVDEGKKFPFIIVSPQSPSENGWKVDVLNALLEEIKKNYRVDADRVYLTGLSMGGYGTWSWAQQYSYQFAAIAPICGGGDASKAWALRHIPTWCFHGAKDNVVSPSASIQMVDSLKKYSKDVQLTLYPDANHNSWDTTYNNEALYSWLLSHKRFRYKDATATNVRWLQAFTGKFASSEKDTVVIVVEADQLIAQPHKKKIALHHYINNTFFIKEDYPLEITFHTNAAGKVDYFELMEADKRIIYKKQLPSKTK